MIARTREVAAIAVVDLARELVRLRAARRQDVRDVDTRLANAVERFDKGENVSLLVEQRYPESWLLALWNLAARPANSSDVGARIGARVASDARGLLSNLMLHSNTLGDALAEYRRNMHLLNAAEQWNIEQHAGLVTLSLSFSPANAYPSCAVERSVIAFHKWGEYFSMRHLPLTRATFSFPEPQHGDYVSTLLACPVSWSAAAHTISFPEELLDIELPQRNPYLKEIVEKRVQMLGVVQPLLPVATQVCVLLEKDLSTWRHADAIAKALSMSRATLYRRLSKEGTCFSTLLETVRKEFYTRHAHMPVAEMCERLGFRDTSAYYKALKRWRAEFAKL